MSNLAIKIEREVLGENVGCQDQIFSSFGGFNCIRFKSDVDFSVENLINNKKKLSLLNNSSILIWSGIQREGQILEKEKFQKLKKNQSLKTLKLFNQLLKKLTKNSLNQPGI